MVLCLSGVLQDVINALHYRSQFTKGHCRESSFGRVVRVGAHLDWPTSSRCILWTNLLLFRLHRDQIPATLN
ncbi:hypothetical protein CC2G_013419 [Coprinopsis cinerea AmutBmut pab1-1]|nr:hypothetical protein CC2G_013419 [Coprinopsis cinerea AmutBmut pab1-1]